MRKEIGRFFGEGISGKTFWKIGIMLSLAVVFMVNPEMAVFASDVNDVITGKFNVLIDLVTGIISSLGMLYTLWGIAEWGVAFQSSEGTMQSSAMKRILGGVVTALAPQIAPILIG